MRDLTYQQRQLLWAIVDKVNALPVRYASMDEQADAVIAIFDGCGAEVWLAFDAMPDSYTQWIKIQTRFFLVRQVRNDRVAGHRLALAVKRQLRKRAPAEVLDHKASP